MLFSLGGAATATMVTAVLPSVTIQRGDPISAVDQQSEHSLSSAVETRTTSDETSAASAKRDWRSRLLLPLSGSRLTGFVGAFAGCGALVALGLFLPLPSRLQNAGIDADASLRDTYYIVGAIAFAVSLFCLFGLRHLDGESHKSIRALWQSSQYTSHTELDSLTENHTPYWKLFVISIKVAGQYPDIGLGYIGGFVARASSVGISLFLPLLVNQYYISSGLCKIDDETRVKTECKEAYLLAAKLTGISQLIALLLAPGFGFLSDKKRFHHIPLLVAAAIGVLGYGAFAFLVDVPDPNRAGGSYWIYVLVCLLGASQIGAIVCSLGLLSRAISTSASTARSQQYSPLSTQEAPRTAPCRTEDAEPDLDGETQTLLGDQPDATLDLSHLKGSIAGTYSLAGGAGILLL